MFGGKILWECGDDHEIDVGFVMSDEQYLPWRVSEVPFGTCVVVDSKNRIVAAMRKEDEHIARFIAQRCNSGDDGVQLT